MKLKIYDNPDTHCRELWINDQIELAVNITEMKNPELGAYGDKFSLLISFAPWEAGKTHMETIE